jgi:hypothetical protein
LCPLADCRGLLRYCQPRRRRNGHSQQRLGRFTSCWTWTPGRRATTSATLYACSSGVSGLPCVCARVTPPSPSPHFLSLPPPSARHGGIPHRPAPPCHAPHSVALADSGHHHPTPPSYPEFGYPLLLPFPQHGRHGHLSAVCPSAFIGCGVGRAEQRREASARDAEFTRPPASQVASLRACSLKLLRCTPAGVPRILSAQAVVAVRVRDEAPHGRCRARCVVCVGADSAAVAICAALTHRRI